MSSDPGKNQDDVSNWAKASNNMPCYEKTMNNDSSTNKTAHSEPCQAKDYKHMCECEMCQMKIAPRTKVGRRIKKRQILDL